MRIAFLILMHKNPEQTIRLVERLQGPVSTFIVHVDQRAPQGVYDVIHSWALKRNDVELSDRHACYWANFGIVSGTLSCMRTALKKDAEFDYAVLLSGQDYPIKPLSCIFEYFDSNRGRQFIESFRLDEGENRWTRQGGQFQAMHRVSWYIVRFRSRRIPIRMRRRIPGGLKPCGGSQWWALSREAVAYITEYLDKNPRTLGFFRHVSVPDETMFQTLTYNSPFGPKILSDDLHLADWGRPEPPYPRVFDISDFEQIRTSKKLFARKFDVSHDTRILDLIDKHLLLVDRRQAEPQATLS